MGSGIPAGRTIGTGRAGEIRAAYGSEAGQDAKYRELALKQCQERFKQANGAGGLGGARVASTPQFIAAMNEACPPEGPAQRPPAPAPVSPTPAPTPEPAGPPSNQIQSGPLPPKPPEPNVGGGPQGLQRVGAAATGFSQPERYGASLGTGLRQQLNKPPGWVGQKISGLFGRNTGQG